jgi:hypothetical protein
MLQSLQDSALAVWVRESPSIFAYTTVLSLHVIGLGTVVGFNYVIGLRVLGKLRGIPLGVLKDFYPVIWFGFIINAVSGVLLYIAAAVEMSEMIAFWAKMAIVLAGMVVSLRLRKLHLLSPPASGEMPDGARKLAWTSLVLWGLAIIVGRLTGYPELVNAMLHF